MAAPLWVSLRRESPPMLANAATHNQKPASAIRGVHDLAMPCLASTPFATGCLLGDVCALLITGLPSHTAHVDHAWRCRTHA